jgi:hypothetical protein
VKTNKIQFKDDKVGRLKESVYNIRQEKDDGVSKRLGESQVNVEIQSEELSPPIENLKERLTNSNSITPTILQNLVLCTTFAQHGGR